MLWVSFKMASFPSSCQKQEWTFPCLHCENLGGLLGMKLTKVGGVRLEHVALEFFSGLSTLSLQQFTNNSFPSPVLVPMVVSAPVSCDPWYLPVCLSRFWGSDLPGDLNFLMDLRKTVDLQISFLVVRTLE